MSIRLVTAAAGALALAGLACGPAAAQTSYANPYGYAYPQPYGGYAQGYGYPQQPYAPGAYGSPGQGYAPQAYAPQGYPPQPYGSPYAQQGYGGGYGAATYVQPYYGSPYVPQAGDPFPEQPAAIEQTETIVVTGASAPANQPAARSTGLPASAPSVSGVPAASRGLSDAGPLPSTAPSAAAEPMAVSEPPRTTPMRGGPSGGEVVIAEDAEVVMTEGAPQAPEGTFDQLYEARYSEPQVAEWTPDPQEGYGGWLSELRFGILEHDAGLWSGKKEDGLDINGEVLFVSPDFLEVIFSPRPTIGGSIHTEGETNVVYFGLTWEWNVTPWLYIEGQWGPAFHDGNLTGQTSTKKGYGCPVLSRGSAAIGLRYEHHSIQAFYSHMSNGDICEENDGIDAAGVRYGYRF